MITFSKQTRISPDDGKYNSFPGLLFTQEKRLIAVWRSGDTHSESIPAYIESAYSDDMGSTWNYKRIISDETIDCRDVRLFQSHTGTIYMTVQVSGVGPRIYKSDNNGDDFTLLADLSSQLGVGSYFGFGRLIEDNGGNLYLGVYEYTETKQSPKVMRSNDLGLTWSLVGTIVDQEGQFNSEAAICFIPNNENPFQVEDPRISTATGYLTAILRNNGSSWVYNSYDDGATWEKLKVVTGFTAHGADLTFTEGNLICAFRDAGGSQAVSMSRDLGFNWTTPINMAEARGGYSQVAHVGNGAYAIVYYTDSGMSFGASDEAYIWFRFFRIHNEINISNKRFLISTSDLNPVANGASRLVDNVFRVDETKNLNVLLKPDSPHKMLLQVRWSFDGKTIDFNEPITLESGDSGIIKLDRKAPYIIGFRIYNNDTNLVSHNYDMTLEMVF